MLQRELKRWDALPWTVGKTPAEEFISLGIDFNWNVHTLKNWKLILPDSAIDVEEVWVIRDAAGLFLFDLVYDGKEVRLEIHLPLHEGNMKKYLTSGKYFSLCMVKKSGG